MTQINIPLNLPIRRIIATDPSADPPNGLLQQFERLRQGGTQAASLLRSALSLSGMTNSRELEQRTALDRVIAELQRTVRTLHTRLDQLLPEIQHVTIELAHAIAGKLVLDKVAANEFPIENLVREVVDRLHTKEAVIVRLHPDDLAVWQRHGGHEATPSGEAELRVIPDASLSRGACRATVGEITVVYELRRQIEEIRQELLSTVDGHARTES